MSPSAAGEEGFFRRLALDPELYGLLGQGTRILPGFPADTPTEAECPRLTFYVFGPPPLVKGIQRIRIALDEWVWPSGTEGGRPRLLAIDERIEALCDEARWEYKDHWICATAGPFRDFPSAPNAPMRRHREIVLDVAAITAAPAA